MTVGRWSRLQLAATPANTARETRISVRVLHRTNAPLERDARKTLAVKITRSHLVYRSRDSSRPLLANRLRFLRLWLARLAAPMAVSTPEPRAPRAPPAAWARRRAVPVVVRHPALGTHG